MRLTPLFSGMILSGLLAAPLSAQTAGNTGVVQTDAEVRCKPGNADAIYPTNLLKRDARVTIVEERADGWLGIEPPEGSFSYINTRYLKGVGCNFVVDPDPTQTKVPVIVGSALRNERPTVVGTHLERGAQVRSRWSPIQDSEGVWLPIEPPAGEVRYVRTEAIQKLAPVQTVSAGPRPAMELPKPPAGVQSLPPPQSSSFIPAPPTQPAPIPPPAAVMQTSAVKESLWSRAQQAERAGRIAEAIEIYNQLYRDNYTSNPEAAKWALERGAFLRSGQRLPATQPTSAAPASPAVNNYATYPPQTKLVPLKTQEDPPAVVAASRGSFANPAPAEKASVQLTSRTQTADDKPSATLSPPAVDVGTSQPGSTQTSTATPKGYASGPGTLVRAAIRIEGQPAYRLLTDGNNPTLYVTAVPGIDLERFLDQRVELMGTAEYRGELRANRMHVHQVQPLAVNP
jgi:hypothetical protein